MSSPDESGGEPSAEGTEAVDTENVGGLGEIVPEPVQPIWRRMESVQEFRRTHGDTYLTVLEAIVAAVLAGGYLYWLYLFLTG